MNNFKNYIILVLLPLLISCNNSNDIPFKANINIQIDGFFNQEEWDHSKEVVIESSATLYLIQNETDLFLGIRNKDDVSRYVDLFIENDSIGTINLHASMQLGERLLNKNWNDTIPSWNWGNNTHWIANKVEIVNHSENISFEKSIKPYQGFEFKISKNKIQSKISKIRIEIKDFIGQESEIVFPFNSERLNTGNWFLLKL